MDQLTTLLATAVTYDRQQVIADGTSAATAPTSWGRGPAFSSEPTGEPSTPASPCGAWASPAGAGSGMCWSRSPLCEGRPSLAAGTLLAQELSKENVPAPLIPDHAAATFLARQGPIWC